MFVPAGRRVALSSTDPFSGRDLFLTCTHQEVEILIIFGHVVGDDEL